MSADESVITESNENVNVATDTDPVSDVDWYSCSDFDSSDEDSDAAFSFETAQAALVGNTDYQKLTKTLAILEVQRVKAVEDINKLEKLRKIVRTHPKEYLKKFLSGDTSDIPGGIIVQQVPKIDWSKYELINHYENYFYNSSKRKLKKKKYDIPEQEEVAPNDSKYDSNHDDDNDSCKSGNSNVNQFETETQNIKQEPRDTEMVVSRVRGRPYDQSKPQTFNQLWTPEEQLRLEELLIEYPPERNENSRWRKIAQALGNRTTKQVCSRVQKYFKKLNKAGLPIPGHQLKTSNSICVKRKQRRKKKKPKARISTFFPTQHFGTATLLDACEEDDKKKTAPSLSEEFKTNLIKQVIEFKKKDDQDKPYFHSDIKCEVCGESPLQGTRWRCLVCANASLCSDCVVSQLWTASPSHPPRHPLEPLTNPALIHLDPDYAPDVFKSSNYLDPNVVSSNVL